MNKVSQFSNWLARMIRRFASWWWSVFRKQSIIGKLIFASVSLCIVCFVCSLPSVILSPSRTPTPQPIIESNPTSESAQVSVSPTDTPVLTNTPIPEPTNTPIPTDTPVPTKFEAGQEVYLAPSLVEARAGPYGLARAVFGWHWLDAGCGGELEETLINHNQVGVVTDILVCNDNTYYKIKSESFRYSNLSRSPDTEKWLPEDQLSNEKISPIGFPFYLKLASEASGRYSNESPYLTYLPPELVHYQGEEIKTSLNKQPVRLTQDSFQEVNEGEDNLYRYFLTSFTIFNDGTERIGFNTQQLLHAKANAVEVEANPSIEVEQEISKDVSVEPQKSKDFEVVWKILDLDRDKDLAVYITVNTPIQENIYVIVNEQSAFVRGLLPSSAK